MTKLILSLLFCLTLSIVSTSSSYAEDIILEPASVVGFGATKDLAKKEARELLDEALTDIDNSLPDGSEVIGVVTVFEWDGIAYEITFQAIVFQEDD